MFQLARAVIKRCMHKNLYSKPPLSLIRFFIGWDKYCTVFFRVHSVSLYYQG